jgi:hypothetical protein
MNESDDLNSLRVALREQLCITCQQRMPGDTRPVSQAARCESDCTLFANLQRLARVVNQGEPPCGYDVFAKSLQPFLGTSDRLNLVQALSVLEHAQAERRRK